MRRIPRFKSRFVVYLALLVVAALALFSTWLMRNKIQEETRASNHNDSVESSAKSTTTNPPNGDVDAAVPFGDLSVEKNATNTTLQATVDVADAPTLPGDIFFGQADRPIPPPKPAPKPPQKNQPTKQEKKKEDPPPQKKADHEGPPHSLADFSLYLKRSNVDGSGKIVPVDPNCRYWRYKLRPSVECNHNVHVALSEIDSPRFASTPLNLSIQPDQSYNDLCRSSPAECPVRWISYLSVCGDSANRLADIVHNAGIPLTILGLGTFWHARWGYRNRVLHDHLRMLPENLLVVWTDAEDLLPTPDISVDKIIARYNELVELYKGPRIFFAAEKACYPAGGLWSFYPEPYTIRGGRGASPFRYLNAGIMVGPAGLIRRMIESVYQDDCLDEQLVDTLTHLDPVVWWHDDGDDQIHVVPSLRLMGRPGEQDKIAQLRPPIPNHAKPLVGIDHWNVLSAAMWGIDNSDFSIQPLSRNVEKSEIQLHLATTNSTPIILHQSGEKKDNAILEILAQAFGYTYDAQKLDEFRKNGKEWYLKRLGEPSKN